MKPGDGKGTEKAMKRLRKEKLIELPGAGAKAEYLTHTYDESRCGGTEKSDRAGHPQVFAYPMHDR